MASKLAHIIAALLVIFTMSTPLAFGQEETDTEASVPVEATATFIPGSIYTGTWVATGYPDLPGRLTIISIDGSTSVVLYQWGDKASAGAQPGGEREYDDVRVHDNELKWGELGERKPAWTFVLSSDGKTLKGRREEMYKGKLVVSEVTMTRE